MLGSGYSQVPLVSESALASFQTMTVTNVIKAHRGDRDKPMLDHKGYENDVGKQLREAWKYIP